MTNVIDRTRLEGRVMIGTGGASGIGRASAQLLAQRGAKVLVIDVNVAGGAVARHAKNPDNAIRFLEYLASTSAQNHFANGNNEWPVVASVKVSNPALQAMTGGSFKSETIPISAVANNQLKVQQMLDRVGYK